MAQVPHGSRGTAIAIGAAQKLFSKSVWGVGPPGGLYGDVWGAGTVAPERGGHGHSPASRCAAALVASSARLAQAAGEDLALLVLANEARAAQNVPPLAWNADLGDAALAHSEDLAAHGGNCDLHNSCNGELWYKRVQRYYPAWVALGENVATSISDPVQLHEGWMSSAGHRANILNSSFTEFGAGIALGQTNFGKLAFATEDFGSRGLMSASAYPALPARLDLPARG